MVSSFRIELFHLCDESLDASHRSFCLALCVNHVIPRMIVRLFADDVNRILAIISDIECRLTENTLHGHTG